MYEPVNTLACTYDAVYDNYVWYLTGARFVYLVNYILLHMMHQNLDGSKYTNKATPISFVESHGKIVSLGLPSSPGFQILRSQTVRVISPL